MSKKFILPRGIWATIFAFLLLTIASLRASVTISNLYTFQETATNGGYPDAPLVQGTDGNLYGTTYLGGTSNKGTIFKLGTNGTFKSLYSFASNNDGANPEGALVQGSDGYFYGTTFNGGPSNYGTIFKISSTGAYTSLYSFTGGIDGSRPQLSGLVEGPDGDFYGLAGASGTNGSGTIFKISTNGALTSLFSFNRATTGAVPEGQLAWGGDGCFYGVTTFGGTSNSYAEFGAGSVFKFSTNGVFTTLHFFNGADGEYPYAGVIQGSDGNFYGTTSGGGAMTNSEGTVFKISSSGTFSNLYTFTLSSNSCFPQDALVEGSDGNFYGTTTEGATGAGGGSVFEITSTGALTYLYNFPLMVTMPPFDISPNTGLVQGNDGGFYGSSVNAVLGLNDGTIYRLSNGLHNSGAPKLQYSADVTNGLAPVTVQFSSPATDSNGNSIVNWSWNFGDGSSSTSQSPSHTYTNFGTYAPTLFVTNNFGGAILASGPQINVSPALVILTNSTLGIFNGTLEFNVSGRAAPNVVIQASSDLQNWTPLQTNAFTSGTTTFADPQSPTNSQRFYRAVIP